MAMGTSWGTGAIILRNARRDKRRRRWFMLTGKIFQEQSMVKRLGVAILGLALILWAAMPAQSADSDAHLRAAVQALRRLDPAHIVVAVPTAAAETCERLATEADEVVCAAMPQPFRAVSLWYDDFPQATDEEVHDLLEEARRQHAVPAHG